MQRETLALVRNDDVVVNMNHQNHRTDPLTAYQWLVYDFLIQYDAERLVVDLKILASWSRMRNQRRRLMPSKLHRETYRHIGNDQTNYINFNL